MAHFRNHRWRWLVALFGLSPFALSAQTYEGCTVGSSTIQCNDEGHAFAAAEKRRLLIEPAITVGASSDCSIQFTHSTFNGKETRVRRAAAPTKLYYIEYRCVAHTPPNAPFYTAWVTPPARHDPRQSAWNNSCSTRPEGTWEWFHGVDFLACKDGCEYSSVTSTWSSAPSCNWINDPFGNRIYRCQGQARTTGSVCVGSQEVVAGDPPPDPDRDGDGTPNESDDAPDDPECASNCGPDDPGPDDPDPDDPGPDDPGPEDPEPEEPGDGQDDGQQVSETLGPKLDAIEQAVLGLGPKVDAVKAAVDAGTAAANSNAAAIVGAINAQGTGGGTGGDGAGTVDLTPLTPGDDGGAHPGLSEIVEEGSVADMLGQLDQDGFGLARSCPAYQWQLSFDLGWTEFNMGPAADFICTALQVFAYMIALAGFIQAAYILGRVGAT
jgi:hypothetical protein